MARTAWEKKNTYASTGDVWIQQRATSPPSCRTLFADAGNVQAVFDDFTKLPDSWPLMRILIPLDGLSLQIERIITCVAAELVATHLYPKTQTKFANLRVEQAEIAAHSSATSGRKKWKTKDGVYQLKDPEKPEQAVPATDDAMYADMLRDV